MVHRIFRSNKLCACRNYADISIIFFGSGNTGSIFWTDIFSVISGIICKQQTKMDRATIFSIRSLVSKVLQVVLLPCVGYVIDDKGLSYSLVMIFICLSVAGGILLGSYYRGKIM